MDGVIRNEKKVPTHLVMDDVRHPLSPLMPEDFETARDHLHKLRTKPLVTLMAEFDALSANPAMQRMLSDIAFDKARASGDAAKPSRADVMAWLDSNDGTHYTFWLMLKKKNPAMTLEQASKIVDRAFTADVIAKMKESETVTLESLRDDANPQLVQIADRAETENDPAKKLEIMLEEGLTPEQIRKGA